MIDGTRLGGRDRALDTHLLPLSFPVSRLAPSPIRRTNPQAPPIARPSPQRTSLTATLFALSVSLFLFPPPYVRASETRYRCITGEKRASVPCTVFLVPMDFNLPLVRVPSETDVTIEPGTYELRAAAPGLALPFNAILNVDTTPHPLRTAILLLQAGGSAVVAPTFVPAHGAAQLLSFSTGRIDTVFVDREHEAPFPAGEFIAVATPKPGIVAGVTDVLRLAPGAVAAATAIRLPTKGTGNLILGARFGAENVDAGADISALWLTSAADQSKHAPKAMTGKGRSAFHAVFYDLPPGSYVA